MRDLLVLSSLFVKLSVIIDENVRIKDRASGIRMRQESGYWIAPNCSLPGQIMFKIKTLSEVPQAFLPQLLQLPQVIKLKESLEIQRAIFYEETVMF